MKTVNIKNIKTVVIAVKNLLDKSEWVVNEADNSFYKDLYHGFVISYDADKYNLTDIYSIVKTSIVKTSEANLRTIKHSMRVSNASAGDTIKVKVRHNKNSISYDYIKSFASVIDIDLIVKDTNADYIIAYNKNIDKWEYIAA